MRRRALFVAVLPVALAGCSALPTSTPKAKPAPVNAQVFFTSDASQDQETAVQRALAATHGVTKVSYENRDQAYRRFKETFKDKPELVESARPEDFTDDIRFQAKDRATANAVVARMRKMPGVRKAQVPPTASPR